MAPKQKAAPPASKTRAAADPSAKKPKKKAPANKRKAHAENPDEVALLGSFRQGMDTARAEEGDLFDKLSQRLLTADRSIDREALTANLLLLAERVPDGEPLEQLDALLTAIENCQDGEIVQSKKLEIQKVLDRLRLSIVGNDADTGGIIKGKESLGAFGTEQSRHTAEVLFKTSHGVDVDMVLDHAHVSCDDVFGDAKPSDLTSSERRTRMATCLTRMIDAARAAKAAGDRFAVLGLGIGTEIIMSMALQAGGKLDSASIATCPAPKSNKHLHVGWKKNFGQAVFSVQAALPDGEVIATWTWGLIPHPSWLGPAGLRRLLTLTAAEAVRSTMAATPPPHNEVLTIVVPASVTLNSLPSDKTGGKRRKSAQIDSYFELFEDEDELEDDSDAEDWPDEDPDGEDEAAAERSGNSSTADARRP